jgi:hypothetical protein
MQSSLSSVNNDSIGGRRLHSRRASLAFGFGQQFESVTGIKARYLLYPFHERLDFMLRMLELSHISFLNTNIFSPLNLGIGPKPIVWRDAHGG